MLDGGNGEEEKRGGWGLGRRKYNHTGYKQHMSCFRPSFRLKLQAISVYYIQLHINCCMEAFPSFFSFFLSRLLFSFFPVWHHFLPSLMACVKPQRLLLAFWHFRFKSTFPFTRPMIHLYFLVFFWSHGPSSSSRGLQRLHDWTYSENHLSLPPLKNACYNFSPSAEFLLLCVISLV